MIGGACGKVDAGAPGFMQGVSRRIDHAWQGLDAFQLGHRRHRQGGLDGRAQTLVVDRTNETAGQPHRGLLERHDLETVTAVTPCRQAAFPHGEAAVNDQGGSIGDGHGRSPSGSLLTLGHRVSGGERRLPAGVLSRVLPYMLPPACI